MENSLHSSIEKKAEKAEALYAFSGVKVLFIRQQIEHILNLIGRSEIFDEYTRHDITHIDQMLSIVEWVIPQQTMEAMTPADWLMLVLSIYFHDMGMLVTKEEFRSRDKNPEFLKYREESYNGSSGSDYREKIKTLGEDAERFLYQEYVRANHAKRIRCWITGGTSVPDGANESTIVQELEKILDHLHPKFKRDLGTVCESHHLDDLYDFSKYETCARYGNTADECVNLHYIAIVLRTADLLHITNDRTPSIQFRLINPSDSKSIVEWQKQRAVTAVAAKDPRDKDGKIDRSLPKDTIEVVAYFDQPDKAEAFFGLSSYIIYMRSEIQKCYRWIQTSIHQEGTENYLYPWQKVDDEKIETRGFEPHKLSFTVDQDSILQMLVGHTLYNNSSVVIRELIQNGLDAVKLQYCIENKANSVPSYIENGKVEVSWCAESRSLTVSDNGTGMTIQEVESFLLTVGISKYRSDAFKKAYPDFPAISRFGIGILTCFLIADDVDIVTNSTDEETGNIINLRKVNGKYLLKKVKKSELSDLIRLHGTSITLYVRADVNINSILADVEKWIVFPPCDVLLDIGEGSVHIGYSSPRDSLIQYLEKHRYTVDDKKYKVEEKEKDGIILAYALEYNTFLQEWGFLTSRWGQTDEETGFSPVGTCIEGIRVEFSPPGYKESSIISAVNTKNCPLVLTNVARSAIEDNSSTDRYLSILYELYAQHIEEQVQALQRTGYSLSWAVSESRYLMAPLTRNAGNRLYLGANISPYNDNLLQERLAEVKCIVIEQDGVRQARSAKEILKFEDVLFVDCEMAAHAESLLRQVKSDTTLLNILRTVQTDIDIPTAVPLFCNYDSGYALHQYALQDKEASSIIVNKKQRRIDIIFSKKTGKWDTIEVTNITELPGNYGKRVHVPIADMEITGITDELGVKTIDGLYLSCNNTFVQYICRLLHQFDYKNSSEDMLMAELLMEIVLNDMMLSYVPEDKTSWNVENIFNNMLSGSISKRRYPVLMNKLWSRIDKNELLGKIFEARYEVYRPQDWSRGAERDD